MPNRNAGFSNRRFCFNPFEKHGHTSWRKKMRLTKVTERLKNKLNALGIPAIISTNQLICSSCRMAIDRKLCTTSTLSTRDEDDHNKAREAQDQLASTNEGFLAESVSVDDYSENSVEHLNTILRLLGVAEMSARDFRSQICRTNTFKSAVESLKNVLNVEGDVFLNESEVPVVKNLMQSYELCTNENKFKLLTIFAPVWSRQQIMDEFGCSKWSASRALEIRSSKGILQLPDPKTSQSVSEVEAQGKSIEFYYESSTIMPGIRDTISIKTSVGRETLQKRLLIGSLNELYSEFRKTYPEQKIGFSTFAKLRPRECILLGANGTHAVCVCMRHENIDLCLRSVGSLPMIKTKSLSQLITSYLVCCDPSENCFLLRCKYCPELSEFMDKLILEMTDFPIETVKFKNWIRVSSHFELVDCLKTKEEFADELGGLLNNFLPHYFTTIKQKEYLGKLKEEIGPDDAVIHADFAENYKITMQNEIQAHHFFCNMVTIHPFVIYYKEKDELKHKTLIVVSGVLDHNYVLVHCCFRKLFEFMSTNFPSLKKIHIWTDGAASQYKNKFNFVNISFMKYDFNVDVEWNFHASSHGKCACDGVGGTIKRSAHKYSLSPVREKLIKDAESFYLWALENQSKIMNFAFVDEDEFHNNTILLKKRMENVITIQGTQSLHFVKPIDRYKLEIKDYSLSSTSKVVHLVKK